MLECVILLHGLARTASSMAAMEKAFQSSGYVVANIDYASREQPIEMLAYSAVGAGLVECEKQHADKISFVTHSLGGILVRYYLKHRQIPQLGRVVMLGPPNQGSEVVDRFKDVPGYGTINGPAGYQLGTTEGSIPRTLGPVTYPVGVIAGTESVNPILSLALPGPNDGKVSVKNAQVDGMTDFITVATSHPFMMQNKEVIRQAIAFVRTGAFIRAAK